MLLTYILIPCCSLYPQLRVCPFFCDYKCIMLNHIAGSTLHLHSTRFLILSTSRLALPFTCPYQSLATISAAALLQLWAFTALINSLKPMNRVLPRLNIILAMILWASSGRQSKLGKTTLQSSRAMPRSCVNSSCTPHQWPWSPLVSHALGHCVECDGQYLQSASPLNQDRCNPGIPHLVLAHLSVPDHLLWHSIQGGGGV